MTAPELAARIRGEVLEPSDPGFDDARVLWNVRLDRSPDLIIRCIDEADVQTAVGYARDSGLELSVKGGGHSYAANSVRDGGLLIDLSLMKSIHVDPEAKIATVQGGVTCAEMDAATQAHGLATPTPTVSGVGVAGAALGGGAGYLSRKYGLTADNTASIDLVTSDGRLTTCSEQEHVDLFWALRGGGWNFGVATSVTLRLHDVGPEVLSGQVIYPFEGTAERLRFFREFMDAAPNEFQCYPFMFRVPPIELFPEAFHGQPVLDLVIYHEDSEAADFVQPLRDLGDTVVDFVAPAPYVQVQQAFDANLPKGQRYYSKAHDLEGMIDGAIDTVVEHIPHMAGALTAAYFDPVGGAIGAVADDGTPHGGRGTRYGFHIIAGWMDASEDDQVMGWASRFHDALAAHSTGGVYVNLIADDEDHRIPAAFGSNYARMSDLKAKWDPSNLFRSNYNIPPSG